MTKYYLQNPSNKRIFKTCYLCGKQNLKPGAKAKYCSFECYSKCPETSLNRSKAGKHSASVRIKRSKDEIELFELIKSQFPDALSNHVIYDGWDADIVIPSLQIAILWNGPWHYKQLNVKNHSLLQVQTRDKLKIQLFESNGWIVKIYEDRYYTPQSAFEDLVVSEGIEPSSAFATSYELVVHPENLLT